MRSYDAKCDARVTHTVVVRHGRDTIQSIIMIKLEWLSSNIRGNGRLSAGCKCKKMVVNVKIWKSWS